MLDDLYIAINAYLVSHPGAMETLRILFWVKYWLLTILMVYFLYRISTEKPQSLPETYAKTGQATFIA